MEKRKKAGFDKSAVSRAARKPLDNYYSAIGSQGYDGTYERPGNWEEDEQLFNSIFKSEYVSKHLDWSYVLELIYAVIDQDITLKPEEFAEQLERAITETADQRDYLAIFPLAFKTAFGFPGMRRSLSRPVVIGQFTISPATPSVKAINKIIAKHKFPLIDESDFIHASRTSHKAFSNEILVTFNVHGAEDKLRFSAEIEFIHLCRLIEIFACIFTDMSTSFGNSGVANHLFLLSKKTGELRRFPTIKSSSFDFELSADLLSAIKRPEFNEFYVEMSSSMDGMYRRMRNAIKFFSMAINAGAEDKVTSFLFYVISIESIFSRDKNNPIKMTLADFGSILCFPPEQRLAAYEMIREAYDLRSSIVHSGASLVDKQKIIVVRSIAARAIYCSLFVCKSLKDGQGKLEDKFFNHLRDRKLGVVNAIFPRAIWSLPAISTDVE